MTEPRQPEDPARCQRLLRDGDATRPRWRRCPNPARSAMSLFFSNGSNGDDLEEVFEVWVCWDHLPEVEPPPKDAA